MGWEAVIPLIWAGLAPIVTEFGKRLIAKTAKKVPVLIPIMSTVSGFIAAGLLPDPALVNDVGMVGNLIAGAIAGLSGTGTHQMIVQSQKTADKMS